MSDSPDKTAGVEPVSVTLPPLAPTMPKVLVCLPWQKQTNPITAFSVMNIVDRRKVATMLQFGDAFVAHSRNACATKFLDTSFEWLFMVDDDMIVPFGHAKWFNAYTGFNLPDKFAGLHAIERLLSHGKTLIGGLYWGRHAKGRCMYSEACNNPTEAAYARGAPYDLIKPTRWVATGCMLVHRSVFEDVERRFPRLSRARNNGGGHWFSSCEHNLLARIDEARALLNKPKVTGEDAYKISGILESASAEAQANSSLGMGEDVALCIRAKECGHQPYVDMGLLAGHVGSMCYGPKNTSP